MNVRTAVTSPSVRAAGASRPEHRWSRDELLVAPTAARRLLLAATLCGVLVGVLDACEGPRVGARSEDLTLAARLTGVWDVELTLDQRPLGTAVAARDGSTPHTRGTLTLLGSARGEAGPFLVRPMTHTGVYDLDLRQLDLPFDDRSPVPTLVAASAAPDSLIVVLPAGSNDAALQLKGTIVSDTVRGVWTYGGARAVGGWTGTFVLRRHSNAYP